MLLSSCMRMIFFAITDHVPILAITACCDLYNISICLLCALLYKCPSIICYSPYTLSKFQSNPFILLLLLDLSLGTPALLELITALNGIHYVLLSCICHNWVPASSHQIKALTDEVKCKLIVTHEYILYVNHLLMLG